MASNGIKQELYECGIALAVGFCQRNNIAPPTFCTYAEAPTKAEPIAYRVLQRVEHGNKIGSGCGLYTHGHVFVNVPATALPVMQPRYRSWSYPGWKTDRTPVGVVAHEVGHYVEHYLQVKGKMRPTIDGPLWRDTIRGKRVSTYEPVPSESWAESMRLFILNPDLLRLAIPKRYSFISKFLLPAVLTDYKEVLNHPDYIKAAEKWIQS